MVGYLDAREDRGVTKLLRTIEARGSLLRSRRGCLRLGSVFLRPLLFLSVAASSISEHAGNLNLVKVCTYNFDLHSPIMLENVLTEGICDAHQYPLKIARTSRQLS